MSIRSRLEKLEHFAAERLRGPALAGMSDAELDQEIERHALLLGLPVPTTLEEIKEQSRRLREELVADGVDLELERL